MIRLKLVCPRGFFVIRAGRRRVAGVTWVGFPFYIGSLCIYPTLIDLVPSFPFFYLVHMTIKYRANSFPSLSLSVSID